MEKQIFETTENQCNRERSVDFIRGVAIALVVLGHCIQCGSGIDYFDSGSYYNSLCFRFIYSFHMPLFAWISGYCFIWSAKKGNKHVIRHVFRSLIVPMAFWSPVFALLNNLIKNSLTGYNFAYDSLQNFLHGFWFLWGIVFCSLLLLITKRMFKGNTLRIALLLECAATLFAFRHFMFYQYAFLYPYFVLGYVFHKWKLCKVSNRLLTSACAFAIWVLIFALLIPFFNKDSFIYVSYLSIIRGPNSLEKQLVIDLYRYFIV